MEGDGKRAVATLERGEAERNPQGRVAAQGRQMGVARPFPSRTMPSSFEFPFISCLISLRLQEYPGDTAGERNGESWFLPVCHLLVP